MRRKTAGFLDSSNLMVAVLAEISLAKPIAKKPGVGRSALAYIC